MDDVGDLPVGWGSASLRDLTASTRPICYGVLKPGEHHHDGIPLIRIVDIKSNRLDLSQVHRISQKLDAEFGRSRLMGGEVLLSIQGTIGRVALVPAAAAGANISRTIAVIEADARASSPFVRYWLLWAAATNQFKIGGTTRNSLNIADIRALECPLPPLPEQHRIVEILEEQLSRIDAALESVRVVREKAAQFRRSLLHAAFTGALTGEEIGEDGVPVGWAEAPLISFVRHRSGNSKIIKGKQSSRPAEGLVQGFSASGADVWVRESEYNEDGVVVSAVGARCGKAFLACAPWTAIANTHALVPDEALDNRFLWYLTNREEWWVKGGTAQPFVRVKATLERPLPLPPLPEQHRIVEILEEQLSRIDASLAAADTIEQRAAALRRSLLHSASTGRLTEQWRQEHAHV